MSDAKSIEQGREAWQRDTLEPRLAEAPERKHPFTTQAMGWPVDRLYTPQNLDAIGFDYVRDVGFPGEYPYTRGTDPNGYRSDLWTMMQVSGFGTGEDWAERGRYMLDQGLTGLFLEYDLPTTNGLDSDHPLAVGEVGRAGIAVDSLDDMEALLDLPFDKLQRLTSICNGPQTVNLAMILAALKRRGIDPGSFTLQMPNAILIEYTCVGRYIFPPDHGLRVAIDALEYSIQNHPNWIPISVVSAQLYAAYANPVQELAFSFAIAKEYLDAALARGFDIDTLAPYFSFITGIDMDFFEAVGKLRAYRKVWARIMREEYGAKRPESEQLSLTASPGTMSLTLQQPLNNIARLGIQMLACVIGNGGHAMNTPLHDEAHALPTEDAIAVGAAVQNIVAHETGVADTVDPLAGSYYVETMTRRIEDAVFEELAKIESMGGALAAIKTGYFQKELARQQYERTRAIEDGSRVLVGVNHSVREGEKRNIEIHKHDPDVEHRQIRKLERLRAERDGIATRRALDRLRDAARSGENLVPPCLEAVNAYATHGEMCGALRDVFGEYHPDSLTTGIS
ncbi:MAG: methylmalonyl-CoA mutase [Deltaproteobacteria bacterium]|nr:methylmalonyl-CoA mutase [Deltaproteobacteria bacterium]MBW2385676.1 methylmalonyl-CoA mutase [Deltaproteobacteria bacterium]